MISDQQVDTLFAHIIAMFTPSKEAKALDRLNDDIHGYDEPIAAMCAAPDVDEDEPTDDGDRWDGLCRLTAMPGAV